MINVTDVFFLQTFQYCLLLDDNHILCVPKLSKLIVAATKPSTAKHALKETERPGAMVNAVGILPATSALQPRRRVIVVPEAVGIPTTRSAFQPRMRLVVVATAPTAVQVALKETERPGAMVNAVGIPPTRNAFQPRRIRRLQALLRIFALKAHTLYLRQLSRTTMIRMHARPMSIWTTKRAKSWTSLPMEKKTPFSRTAA